MSVFVIIASVIFDAWRDAWIGEAWWPRHIVKWLAFYTPLVYILHRDGFLSRQNLKNLVILAFVSLLVWRMVYDGMTAVVNR